MDISRNKHSIFSIDKSNKEKCLKKNTSTKKITLSNRGSVSVEALFSIPIFIFLMMSLIFTLRFLAVDDSFNQCLYESAIEYSMLDNSSSDIINSAVFNILLKKNLKEMNLKVESLALTSSKDDFIQISACYNIETLVSKPLIIKENIRIYKRTNTVTSFVYITPNGKKYHYEDCILTKGNGIRFDINEVPKSIDACKNCILGNRYFKKN